MSSGVVEEIVATQEDADAIIPRVEEVLAASGLEVNVRLKNMQSRYVNLEIDGEEAGYLIGRNGEVLNALQYLMNISISQSLNNGVRVTLDADDYRSQRETSLMRYAERIAQEVRNRREEAVLDPLPAFERRIIHKALSEIDGVTTYSEGEEPNRRVVIAPAEETAGKA
ncbi:RNA-binding protein [Candidatus Nitrosymbiomonas proteolyticus]|uniref:RNA-binding protein n=1 Tax=Candidatus Nitrosymbiomonas proteolyticus TaxID=2608984 RepID=A0A809R5T0_9BACT|nr:RNA-binding protein [Candidatus Nitrosymbiomonas proteolyticus]